MSALLTKFLQMVAKIKSLKPKYRQPGDGSDGTCDCIGLIIGALRRSGLKWPGIHGSNYAARRASVGLKKISSSNELEVGDMVFKAYDPGQSKYNLPGRYKQGGAYYNGDLKDYYHVGVVTQINPLNITHMTRPTVKVDTTLGKWGYKARIKPLVDAGAYSAVPTPAAPSTGIGDAVSTSKIATVYAPTGRYVKMRKEPSMSCGVYDEVPIGAKVTLVKPGEAWAQIDYGKRKGWYMMAKFLKV